MTIDKLLLKPQPTPLLMGMKLMYLVIKRISRCLEISCAWCLVGTQCMQVPLPILMISSKQFSFPFYVITDWTSFAGFHGVPIYVPITRFLSLSSLSPGP